MEVLCGEKTCAQFVVAAAQQNLVEGVVWPLVVEERGVLQLLHSCLAKQFLGYCAHARFVAASMRTATSSMYWI